MTLLAKNIKHSQINSDIQQHVQQCLQIIDIKIASEAQKWAQNFIIYEPANFFNFRHVPHDMAMKIVYSSIILDLEKRGFMVTILRQSLKLVFKIEWPPNINHSQLSDMDRIVQTHMAPNQHNHNNHYYQ